MDLETATTPRDGALDVPAGWRQGAGAYGGLVVAAMMRAADQAIGDPTRPIRSATAEIFAPVDAARATFVVDILRAGKSVTTVRSMLVQDGQPRAHCVVVAGADRANAPAWNTTTPPLVPTWDESAVMPSAPEHVEFAQHFHYRVVEGLPGAGSGVQTIGWVQARAPGSRRDAAYLAAMIDVWYPGALVKLTTPRPMATITFTFEAIDCDAGDGPLLYRGVSPVCSDGYFTETRELWRADGTLLARNHQTFVIIK